MSLVLSPKDKLAMCADLVGFRYDPLRYVLYAFPWGVKGTPLEDHKGPRKWQREVMASVGEKLRAGGSLGAVVQEAVSSGHGIGKAHPHSMMLHTPDGHRRWGDLRAGDQVFMRNGMTTKILAVKPQGILPMYRVTFDDGSSTRVSSGHLWTVRGRNERRTGTGWVTLSTQQIMDRGVTRSNGKARAKQWELPRHAAVEFPSRVLGVNPYTLGVWLGDGGRNTGRITSADSEVIDRLLALGEPVKRVVGSYAWSVHGLKVKLRALGVLDKYSYQKSVPTCFMEAPSDVRAEVLRGLLDTDGECNAEGSVGFSSCSYSLAQDVIWLARSLGGKASMQPTVKHPKYNGPNGEKLDGRPCWRVTVTMPHGFRCFYIHRKQTRVRAVEDRYLARWIASIEPDGEEECSCISVDNAEHLYLANDFIVTHNSALVSWLILWAMSTLEDTRGVVTASTDTQLRTKTWPEVAKWHRLALNQWMFTVTATAIYSTDPGRGQTWRIDAVPWSDENSEAFAGLHNQGRRILVLFDEGSAIADKIWEVVEGALTDAMTEIVWAAFGNPTRNTGRFKECFGRFKHRWTTRHIDSRTVEGATNLELAAAWVADYGEDSDFVRVRVRGEFPKASSLQFIPSDTVELARKADAVSHLHEPLILGVDVARFGDDQSVVFARRGRDWRTWNQAGDVPGNVWKFRGLPTDQLTARVIEIADKLKADAIFVDGGGVGGGVVDLLRALHRNPIDVQFGAKSDTASTEFSGAVGEKYANKRAEMWGSMRAALKAGVAMPDDPEIAAELCSVEYSFNVRDEILLERKADMKKRGLASPDIADAIALTYAHSVPMLSAQRLTGAHRQVDYDPYA